MLGMFIVGTWIWKFFCAQLAGLIFMSNYTMYELFCSTVLHSLKGGGHAKNFCLVFISIDSLNDVLYDVYVYFSK